MTTAVLPNAPDLAANDYLVLGLATCFLRGDDGIEAITVVEPVPSAYLEAVFKGVPTSYKSLHAVELGSVVQEEPLSLPSFAESDAQLGSNFVERCIAAARTYKHREVAKEFIPLGNSRSDINYSTEKKRILNQEHIVTPADNVKQHEHTHKVL
ncbi:uncharacterized protein XM38_000460 [Halomicronema hongdechloris C2206]|uniref:Uncharacterized protein n=1 Tax=Halomicronema hongdechloris C2206 TaxID=1641165 RepID=A0A1Z3HFR7_9CYAN|nr:hypothetical protein [Halomicronema hongdechloris]ASC69120.1 uncharacterized protein XM38_000460 [Halomicronema hongdechloris C2206]